jgi:hypothetical protein
VTINEAKIKGAEHAKQGLSLSPFDCKDVDAEILASCKASPCKSRAKQYAELRSSFNKGWHEVNAQGQTSDRIY